MIYRYVDRVNEKFVGGISVEKGVKSKHYIKKLIFKSKDSPLNLFKLLQLLTNEGMNLVDAFELISESDNFNVDRKKSKEMLDELKNGVPFSESVANHYNVDSFIISFLFLSNKYEDIDARLFWYFNKSLLFAYFLKVSSLFVFSNFSNSEYNSENSFKISNIFF